MTTKRRDGGGSPDQEEMKRMLLERLDGNPTSEEGDGAEEDEEEDEGTRRAKQQLEADDEQQGQEDAASDDEHDGEDEGTEEFQPPEDWDEEGKAFLAEFEDPADRRRIVEMVSKRVQAMQQMAEARYREADQGLKIVEAAKNHGVQGDATQAVEGLLQLNANYIRDPFGTLDYLVEQGVRTPQGQKVVGSDLAQNFVKQIAARLGVKSLEDPEPPEFLDPATGDAFTRMNQRLQGIETRFDQQTQAQQEAARAQQAHELVQNFRASHPHFDQVENDMAMLVRSGRVQQDDLEGAYQLAVLMNGLPASSTADAGATNGADQNGGVNGRRLRRKTTSVATSSHGRNAGKVDKSKLSIEEALKQTGLEMGMFSPSDF